MEDVRNKNITFIYGRLCIYIKGENEVIDLLEKLRTCFKKNVISQNCLNKGYFLKDDAHISQFIPLHTQSAYELGVRHRSESSNDMFSVVSQHTGRSVTAHLSSLIFLYVMTQMTWFLTMCLKAPGKLGTKLTENSIKCIFLLLFFMGTILKVFIEFITVLFLFYASVLLFGPQGMWELSSLTRDHLWKVKS